MKKLNENLLLQILKKDFFFFKVKKKFLFLDYLIVFKNIKQLLNIETISKSKKRLVPFIVLITNKQHYKIFYYYAKFVYKLKNVYIFNSSKYLVFNKEAVYFFFLNNENYVLNAKHNNIGVFFNFTSINYIQNSSNFFNIFVDLSNIKAVLMLILLICNCCKNYESL